MENWSKIGRIKYNNVEYISFINSKYQVFYLKVLKNGEMTYPDLDEYLELTKRYSFNKFTGRKHKDKNSISFEPKIFVKNKVLPLSVAFSLMLSSTGIASNIDTINK